MRRPFQSALLTTVFAALVGWAQATEPTPAPVSVSALNYAHASWGELNRLDGEKNQVNPSPHPLTAIATPQRFVFLPGEVYPTDLTYEEICGRLSAALAKKGYLNATDAQGRVYDPANVDLILRVNFGERPWRIPTARIDQLAWRDGLAPPPRFSRLSVLGAEVSWESRVGGNDDALGAAAANQNSPSFGSGSSSPGSAPAPTPPGTNPAATEYESTREYYLIVVDAFSYKELREKGDLARRQWTAFVAAPRQPGQKFSDVVNTMLRVATPYFGETARGLQVFNDARARVDFGEFNVIEDDVSPPPKK